MFGPESLLADAAGAGISTLTNSPEEWEPNSRGFGRRLASNVGKGIIKNTTSFALEEAFKLDSRFIRSQDRSAGAKFKNALASTFTTRTETGKRIFGFPRIAGAYTEGIVSTQLWYPKRFGVVDGLKSGTITLGTDVLFNLFREFVHK